MFQKVEYKNLNARQKESYNFQKVSSIFADYGFSTIRLSDDWQGADFIAQHIDGSTFLKVQLKSRITFDKKYKGKELKVCFPYGDTCYLYDHDELLNIFLKEFRATIAKSKSWTKGGGYSTVASKKMLQILEPYKL